MFCASAQLMRPPQSWEQSRKLNRPANYGSELPFRIVEADGQYGMLAGTSRQVSVFPRHPGPLALRRRFFLTLTARRI